MESIPAALHRRFFWGGTENVLQAWNLVISTCIILSASTSQVSWLGWMGWLGWLGLGWVGLVGWLVGRASYIIRLLCLGWDEDTGGWDDPEFEMVVVESALGCSWRRGGLIVLVLRVEISQVPSFFLKKTTRIYPRLHLFFNIGITKSPTCSAKREVDGPLVICKNMARWLGWFLDDVEFIDEKTKPTMKMPFYLWLKSRWLTVQVYKDPLLSYLFGICAIYVDLKVNIYMHSFAQQNDHIY